jgi:hypothetical protein
MRHKWRQFKDLVIKTVAHRQPCGDILYQKLQNWLNLVIVFQKLYDFHQILELVSPLGDFSPILFLLSTCGDAQSNFHLVPHFEECSTPAHSNKRVLIGSGPEHDNLDRV